VAYMLCKQGLIRTAPRMLARIVKGSSRSDRTTRLHDENDVFMGLSQFQHLPHALWTTAQRKLLGRLPVLPWWPYPAITAIEKIITSQSVVLEYGIGMSTLWLAPRALKVYGVEGSPEWYREIKRRLCELGATNVSLHLRDSTNFPERGHHSNEFNDHFASLDGVQERNFDLVIVDGAARWLCVTRALPAIRPGGYLYLDNSDADKDWAHYTEPGQKKEAKKLLLEAEESGLGICRVFRGLAPATLTVTEGLLLRRTEA
jgi:hypothetical protein